MDPRRMRILGALVARGDAPLTSLPRVQALGASLLPTSAYVAPATQPRTDAVYVTRPEQQGVYVYRPGEAPTTTAPTGQSVSPVPAPGSGSVSVTAPAPAPTYGTTPAARALLSPALPWPSRLEPYPYGQQSLVGAEYTLECTPENVASYLFRAGDYAYAQQTLRDLLGRKPASHELPAVIAWSRAVCDAVSVALSALNLWHVPSADGAGEVIAKHYQLNPALAVGFNPELYRGYVENPRLAAFWQRHFRGTAFLSAGSQYNVLYAPNVWWTAYAGSGPRVLEMGTHHIPDPRRAVTAEMTRQSPPGWWDAQSYDRYVLGLWSLMGGAANTTPSWLAIVGIPKRSETDIAWSRDTWWISRPLAQLEFCTAWADFIIETSFTELFKACIDGWTRRYVAPDAISQADAAAVARAAKDLTSIGNVAGAWAAGLVAGGSALIAAGPVGAVATFAISVLTSAVTYARSVSAAQELRIELARHPVITPLLRRWFVAAECNASGGPALDTVSLMTKYGQAFATLLTRLTSAATAPSGRSAPIADLLTAKKRSAWPVLIGLAAAVGAIALLKRKR